MSQYLDPQQAFPPPGHDHSACIATILSQAEAICAGEKARLTAQRRRVLEIVAESHTAAGAYDILQEMTGNPAPVMVYRALDFLMAHGLVHRLESLNAFVACAHPGAPHGAQFLICSDCHVVAEMDQPAVGQAIQEGAQMAGFTVDAPVIEISGRCANCPEGGSDAR